MYDQQILLNNRLYYVMYAIQVAAAAVSLVVIISLLIPLSIQLKNGTFNQSTRSQGSRREQPYSTYNLYLVYLSFVDLAFLLSLLVAEGHEIATTPSGYPFGSLAIADFVAATYAMVNVCINSVILYEVLLLLQASKGVKRISQPSLKRVNLQAGMVILFLAPLGLYRYFSIYELVNPSHELAAEIIFWFVNLAALLYCFAVAILVKWKGYLPPINGATARDKAVRGLTIYFFRVILVFLVIWIPGAVLYSMETFITDGYFSTQRMVFLLHSVLAFQPILTFCMILTKPDVKKYIMDLVTLSYVFGASSCCSRKKAQEARPDDSALYAPNANDVVVQRRTNTTILGYTFSDVDENDGAVGGNSDGEEVVEGETNSNTNVDMETGIRSI